MKPSEIKIYLLVFAVLFLSAGKNQAQEKFDNIERYLYGSLHLSKTFYQPTKQGVFVYDINNGHKLVKEFPAVKWEVYNQHQNTGWAGVGAHAGTGRFFQVQDGQALRAYDIKTEKLLWEIYAVTDEELEKVENDEERQKLYEKRFSYIDRRFDVTKDGKYLIVPDRDANLKDKLGNAVVRVLDASTGEWVRNIALRDPETGQLLPPNVRVHNVHALQKYIYVSMWNSGYIYCLSPKTLEVVHKVGPVTMEGMEDVQVVESTENKADEMAGAGHLTLEPEHQLASIQHFSVDESEQYVYAEPVKARGLGVIDIETGKFLGRWDIPEPEPGSLRARRYGFKEAEANQLHSKRNHGIAARPNSYEVWMTEDRWGLLHVWDVASFPPKYVRSVPVFEDIRQPIRDLSWLNFSIDGKYVYASNKVIDADEGVIIAQLDGLNEACLEIQMKDGEVIRTGHDMGSGIATWTENYGPASLKMQLVEEAKEKPKKPETLSKREMEQKGYTQLFNGKDLAGWDGPPEAWWIEDGALTWENTAEDPLQTWPYLIWQDGEPENFELLVDFKLSKSANSGVNFRSSKLKGDDKWALGGYQADITGDGRLTGTIYRDHPSRPRVLRGQKVAVAPGGEHSTITFAGEAEVLEKAFIPDGWNTMRVVCNGPMISYYINDVLVSELIDNDKKASYKGHIGLQMHQGPPMKVQYKNIYLKEL